MMQCDCGSVTFLPFGPFPQAGDKDEDGLRMIYTCTKCGDQLRVYQASKRPKGFDVFAQNKPGENQKQVKIAAAVDLVAFESNVILTARSGEMPKVIGTRTTFPGKVGFLFREFDEEPFDEVIVVQNP